MMDDPQHQKLLQLAAGAREDMDAADKQLGALEHLHEAMQDAVVVASLPKCEAFRRLVRPVLEALAPLVAAAERRDPPPADFDPARVQPLIDAWQAARTGFHRDCRKHKDYLEMLARRAAR